MEDMFQQSRSASTDRYLLVGAETLLKIHSLMVRARVLEERLIKMSKSGEGFFWIGGPGEEGLNVPLGLLVKKGQGPEHDYLHLHYRSSSLAIAMGVQPIDILRQMRSTATDPFSKGRHFVNHLAIPELNIMPISPTIETQYATAIGTGIAQRRLAGEGITIVNGGDWGAVFGMPAASFDGNDPVESCLAIREAMAYCRRERRPYLLEARVSRLYGHSSSSGANRVSEPDCIAGFEAALLSRSLIAKEELERVWRESLDAIDRAHQQVKGEPFPEPESIWENVFSGPLPDSYPRKGGS